MSTLPTNGAKEPTRLADLPVQTYGVRDPDPLNPQVNIPIKPKPGKGKGKGKGKKKGRSMNVNEEVEKSLSTALGDNQLAEEEVDVVQPDEQKEAKEKEHFQALISNKEL